MKVDYNNYKMMRCRYIAPAVAAAAPLIGSAVSAGSNLIGSMFGFANNRNTNKTNLKIAQMNNEFNERMLQKQIDYNTEMWNKENEYNTASAQRQRIEAAGLNPNLMMNGGNAGTASSAGAISPPTASEVGKQEAFSPDFSGIGSAVQTAVAQMQQREVNLANIQKTNEEANGLRIENQYRAAKAVADIANMQSKTNDNNASAALKNIEYALQDQTFGNQVKYRQHEAEAMEWNALSGKINYYLKNKELATFDERFRYDCALTMSDINLKYEQGYLTRKQAEHEAEKRLKTIAEKDGVKLSNEQMRELKPYVVEKARKDASHAQWGSDLMKDAWTATGIIAKPIDKALYHFGNAFELYKKAYHRGQKNRVRTNYRVPQHGISF